MRGHHHLIVSILLIGLTGCSTPAYRAASGPSGYGYQEAALEEGRYRVTFRGHDQAQAYDFALLRAAEITLAKGYDWFRITSGFSDDHDIRRARSSVTVGTGYGGWGGHSSRWGVGLGFPLGDTSNSAVHSFDIVMGKGEKPQNSDDDRVYDAKSVVETIGPRARPPKAGA